MLNNSCLWLVAHTGFEGVRLRRVTRLRSTTCATGCTSLCPECSHLSSSTELVDARGNLFRDAQHRREEILVDFARALIRLGFACCGPCRGRAIVQTAFRWCVAASGKRCSGLPDGNHAIGEPRVIVNVQRCRADRNGFLRTTSSWRHPSDGSDPIGRDLRTRPALAPLASAASQ